MKNSGIEWIGEIPEHWGRCKIKRYCLEVFPGATPQSTNPLYWDGDINWIPSGSCHDCRIDSAPKTITQEGFENSSTKMIPANTALVAMTGATCGNTGYLTISSCANQSVTAYIENKSVCDSLFLWYVLRAAKEHLLTFQTGGAQGGVNVENCKNIFVPYVPLPEQQAISAYLDRQCALIDSVTEKTKASIEEYKKLRQAVITQAVTKGVRGDRPMKEVENGFVDHIPNNWIYQKVKNFIAMPVIDGPHESPELYDDGIPYISATAIVDSKIDFSLMRGYISAEYCDECDKRYKPQINDILLIKLGASTGQVAIVDTDRRFNIWVPLAAIRCDDSVVPKFIYYSFQSEYLLRQMELSWTYGTQQTLGVKTIEQLRFVLPIIDEQQEIAAYLDRKCAEIDALITKKETFLAELEAYKKSLIYEYVTGKKEVPLA